MGNTVTLCNLTKAILVVRLSQLTPLYYDYDLEPGKCMERKVGMVWFTIEVATRIFDDGNTTYESLGREAFIHVSKKNTRLESPPLIKSIPLDARSRLYI